MKIFTLLLLGFVSSTPNKDIYQGVLDDLSFRDPRIPFQPNEKKEKEKIVIDNEEKRVEIENPKCTSNSELLRECQSNLKDAVQEKIACMTKTCPSDGIPFFKQFIRSFSVAMKPLEYDENTLGTKVVLTNEQYKELQAILKKDNTNAKDILDLFDQYNAFQPILLSVSMWSEVKTQFNINVVIAVIVGLITVLLALCLLRRIFVQEINWRRLVVLVISTGFLLSIPWEWYRMYKVALSKKASKMMMEIPAECSPQDLTAWKSMSLWFSKTFTLSDDNCAAYHESLLVDPIWEVSPLQATSVCLSRFFFEPMKYFSAALGESFKLFFKEIPAQWQPFLFIAMVLIIMFIIVSMSGLRIETPLLKINVNPREEVRYIEDVAVDNPAEGAAKRLPIENRGVNMVQRIELPINNGDIPMNNQDVLQKPNTQHCEHQVIQRENAIVLELKTPKPRPVLKDIKIMPNLRKRKPQEHQDISKVDREKECVSRGNMASESEDKRVLQESFQQSEHDSGVGESTVENSAVSEQSSPGNVASESEDKRILDESFLQSEDESVAVESKVQNSAVSDLSPVFDRLNIDQRSSSGTPDVYKSSENMEVYTFSSVFDLQSDRGITELSETSETERK